VSVSHQFFVTTTRTDLGKRAEGTKLAPNPRDPLYFETATTLPVDFHSFRRAFNTALAEAGVNVQHAMHLAAHADPKTHMRYVMNTIAMRTIPEAALPRLPAGNLPETIGRDDSRDDSPLGRTSLASRIVTARDDSTESGSGLGGRLAQLRDPPPDLLLRLLDSNQRPGG